MNAKRASGADCDGQTKAAVPALDRDPVLTANARAHSQDMVAHGHISHTRNDGTPPSEWAVAGYCGGFRTTTLAKGQSDPGVLVDSFFNEPTICANLLDPAGERIGIGIVTDAAGDYALGATVVVGTTTP